jgi:PAS domain S-box-containing protein
MLNLFRRSARSTRRRSDGASGSAVASGNARSRIWIPAFVIGAVAVALLALLPYDSPRWSFVYLCTTLVSLVVLFGAALAMPLGVRTVWWCLFAFQLLTMAAQALMTEAASESEAPTFPGMPDWLSLLAYVPVLVALGILIQRLNPGRDREAWIDSSILSVAAASVFGLFLIVPVLTTPGVSRGAVAVAVTYPMLDLAVLASLIWLLIGGGRPKTSLLLVAVSFAITLGADILRDLSLVNAWSSLSDALLPTLRVAALVTMAAASTAPNAESIAVPRESPRQHATTSRLAVLAVGVLAVPALVAIRLWSAESRLTLLLALAAIIIIILAVWRIGLLVTTVDQQRQVTELVLDSAGDGIVGLDREGFVVFANLSARRMLRCRESDLIGRRFHDVAHHERADGRTFPWADCPVHQLVLRGGEGYIPDQVYVRRDGTTFPVEIVVSPLRVDGMLTGAVQSFRDVSERHAVEELKRQFVSVVSHELRTPLTSIKGSLQMLDSGIVGTMPPEQAELVSMAVSNSERLSQLVNDILDLERLDAGRLPLKPESVAPGQLAELAIAGMGGAAGAAGIRLVAEIDTSARDARVFVDPHRMVQVLTNLIGNAIKFSDRGARIVIRASVVGETAQIAVVDRGRGIPVEHLESVFDRFGQVDAGDSRREGGTGLGLAIAREITVRSGGEVTVTSAIGVGSTFTVGLPIVDEIVDTPPAPVVIGVEESP